MTTRPVAGSPVEVRPAAAAAVPAPVTVLADDPLGGPRGEPPVVRLRMSAS